MGTTETAHLSIKQESYHVFCDELKHETRPGAPV